MKEEARAGKKKKIRSTAMAFLVFISETSGIRMQIAEGNRFARERLISLYMRNVVKIALSMAKQNELDIEDAISSGFVGLLNAVDKFDPSGFSAFHSYASMWITQGIQRDCNPKWMDYYFPAHYKDQMYKAFQKYEQYTTGEEIGSSEYSKLVHEIADELEMDPNIVFRVLKSAITQKYGKLCFEDYIERDIDDADDIPEELIQVEDAILDKFGKDVTTYAYDMENFRVETDVVPGTVFYSWVFGFGGKVVINGPAEVKEQYKELVLKAAERL